MGADDDLLNPDEIEALLQQTGGGAPSPPPESSPPAADAGGGAGGDLLDPNEIEALLSANGGGAPAPPPAAGGGAPPPAAAAAPPQGGSPTENLLNQAESDLAAALAPNLGGTGHGVDTSGATPFEMRDLGKLPPIDPTRQLELSALQDVELDLRIELGKTELLIEEVVSLKSGAIVPLDKLAGDPVDIIVNGRLIARGEVLVLNDNFCVRVAEILTPEGH